MPYSIVTALFELLKTDETMVDQLQVVTNETCVEILTQEQSKFNKQYEEMVEQYADKKRTKVSELEQDLRGRLQTELEAERQREMERRVRQSTAAPKKRMTTAIVNRQSNAGLELTVVLDIGIPMKITVVLNIGIPMKLIVVLDIGMPKKLTVVLTL